MSNTILYKHIVLSGGYYYKAKDGGKDFCETIARLCGKQNPVILDCLFARSDDGTERFNVDCNFFKTFIPESKILFADDDFIDQAHSSDVIFFQGGSPRMLIDKLNTFIGFEQAISDKVLVGSSGGADALVRHYAVLKKMRYDGEGLGILNIKFIPHWHSNETEFEHVNWESLKQKIEMYKESIPVVCLEDGQYLVF